MSRTKQDHQPQTPASPVRPEAELESRLAAALSAAFPNIPREQLVEQRRFTVPRRSRRQGLRTDGAGVLAAGFAP